MRGEWKCEALRLFIDTPTPPELILLDLKMPVLDGWGFLAERAKDPLLADIPVVIMSGCSDVTQKAKEAGAAAVAQARGPAGPREPHRALRSSGLTATEYEITCSFDSQRTRAKVTRPTFDASRAAKPLLLALQTDAPIAGRIRD